MSSNEPTARIATEPAAPLLRELAALSASTASLIEALGQLERDSATGPERRELARGAIERLRSSVARPLAAARELTASGASDALTTEGSPSTDIDAELWELTKRGTMLRVVSPNLLDLQEAVAALQDLMDTWFGEALAAGKLDELAQLQSGLPCSIRSRAHGPYLVTRLASLVDHLGQPMPLRPQLALCRCGRSKSKPHCDGSHANGPFETTKDAKRVPDRRDIHTGRPLTILDNRGACAHSGFCTDRLPSVFHVGKEPFVSPMGARADEILRAVRSCPSGALRYAIDDRDGPEPAREGEVEVSLDGPYRVTGGIALLDADGEPEQRNEGASVERYSLCRCGHSQNKPFCSGMHWYVNFHDPVPDADREPTLFEWAGGLPALTRVTRTFYSKYVPDDDLIGPLFANMSPDHPEKVAAWLGEVFGGPKNYSEKHGGYVHMISEHIGKRLTEAQRARWVSLICKSSDEAGLPADPEFRAAFVAYVEWGSRIALENSQAGAKPPPHMPMPRWDWVCGATPGARVSALGPAEETHPAVVLPNADEAVSYAKHVKALFRRMDRESMKFAFDLWAHADVKRHGAAILARLEAGTMPCDGAWPRERVEVFRRWVDAGMPD